MVSEIQSKVYADWKQIELLRRRKKEGTLGRLLLTRPLWLRKEIAAELGFNAGEEDFLLEPGATEPGGIVGIGRIPQPTITPQPITTTPRPSPAVTPITPKEQVFGGTFFRAIYPDGSIENFEILEPGDKERIRQKGGQLFRVSRPRVPEDQLPITAPAGIPPPAISLTGDYGLLYEEYKRTGGTLDVVEWGAAGAPLRPGMETEPTDEGLTEFLSDLAQAGQIGDVENILRLAQVSEEEIDQIVGAETRQRELTDLMAKTFPELDLEGFVNLVETGPDAFLEQLQQGGYTPDKENLLRTMGFSPEDIDRIIPPWWTLDYWKQAFFKPYGGKDLKGKAVASFIAGIGDVIKTTGGAARWLGWEDAGNVLTTIGTTLGQVAPPDTLGEFEVSDLLNPEFYATKITRIVPFALSLLPLAIGGYSGGAAIATALGVGRIGSMIIGGLAGAALSRPLESAMEAGGAYDDAIARGKTEAEAKKEADEVFKNNMTLAGADAFQIAIALAPTPKWVPSSLIRAGLVRTARIGGKMTIVGLSEGGEELYQDMISRHARGEEWQLDPVSKEVFAIGMVMGLGGGLGGDVLSGVVDKAKTRMSDSLRSQFNRAVADFKAEGFTTEQAELRALDAIAETPEGEKVVSDAVKEVAPQPGVVAPEVKPAIPEKITPAPEVTKLNTSLVEKWHSADPSKGRDFGYLTTVGEIITDPKIRKQFERIKDVGIYVADLLPRGSWGEHHTNIGGKSVIYIDPRATEKTLWEEIIHADRFAKGRPMGEPSEPSAKIGREHFTPAPEVTRELGLNFQGQPRPALEEQIIRLVPPLKRPPQGEVWTIALRDIPEDLGEELLRLGGIKSQSMLRSGVRLKDGRFYRIDTEPARFGNEPQLIIEEVPAIPKAEAVTPVIPEVTRGKLPQTKDVTLQQGTLYHNTSLEDAQSILKTGFRVEDTSKLSPSERGFASGNLGDGVYLSPNYSENMNFWGGQSNLEVKPTRPLRLYNLGDKEGAAQIDLDFADNLKKQGYDGIIVNDPNPHSGGFQVVVFDPSLIKAKSIVEYNPAIQPEQLGKIDISLTEKAIPKAEPEEVTPALEVTEPVTEIKTELMSHFRQEHIKREKAQHPRRRITKAEWAEWEKGMLGELDTMSEAELRNWHSRIIKPAIVPEKVTPAPEVTREQLVKEATTGELEQQLAYDKDQLQRFPSSTILPHNIELVEAELKARKAIPKAEIPEAKVRVEPTPARPRPEVPAVAEAIPTEKVEITTPTGEKIPSTISEAPAPPEGATARVFSRIQTEYAEPNFKEKVRQGWHQFNIKMVDDLDPIRRITEEIKKGDVQLSIDENPYLLARLLRGVTSKATAFLEFGTFGKKFWKLEKGKAVPNYTGESLQNILNEVKDPVVWRDFSTYLTARRAMQLSERNIETGIEVADARASIAELEGKYANFPGLAQRVYKYQDNVLVYGREMGLFSDDLLAKLRKYGDYVPFYRVFNELQAKGLFGKKMANVASPIKRIKGSEREIINPLESIVKNTYVLVSAADRNQVGIAIANLVDKNPEMADVFERVRTPVARVAQVSAKELGVDIEGMTDVEEEQMVDIFRPSFFVRGDEVTVLIDGKKNYYRVDADLRDSLLRLDRESLGLLGKWLGAPARWLRAGATLSPDFMFRNPARDQMSAFAYSNYGFMPGIDFIKGIASMLRKDSDYQLFRMSGAEHSMIVSMDRSYLRKTFKQLVGEEGFIEYVKHPLELFRIISEMGEKGTRLGEFRKGIQQGAVPLEAGYSARAVTLDFAQVGTTAQAINTFIAFFNANIRGWGRMVSSFKEHPVRTSAKVFLGITLPSILLWAANHDDERWKEIPQWQKDLFWIIFVGDNIYRIPKPFELGIIFGSFPERFLDFLVEKDPDLMKDLATALMEAGSPGFIPTAGLPILEWMTNYSFFRGRAIVPESRKDLPPELQYTAWTSEVSKKLGELLKLPPVQIDNLLFAWTGGLGRYATDILDGILKRTGISPDIPQPSPTLADMPVIKAFIVRSPYGSSSEAVNDFYDFLEKYEGGEKYLKEMLIAGETEKYNKFKAAHPELFFFADFESERYAEAIAKGETPKDVFYSSSARYLRRVARQLSEIRKKEDLIYKDPDMSPEKKRQLIDELEILKTDIARKAVDLLQMKDPTILQDMINETINRLGEVIGEGTPLSLEEPDIHDMGKLNQDFKSILEEATVEELQKLEGVNPLAIAWVKKEGVEKTIEPIINKQIKDIDFKFREGVTFEDYYKSWQAGIITDSPLDKLSKRQIELIRGYQGSKDKKAYLNTLSDKDREALNLNPQKEYLKSHPKENAQLAVWGQAKLLTKEAYDEFKRLITELDIPDSAIPEMTLPPEGSIDNYFKYQDMDNKNSWEAQLMMAQDDDLREFMGRQPIDTPIASLELKVKNRKHDDAYEALETDEERAQYKLDNPEWVDDTRRITAIEVGTNEAPTSDENVNLYVERGKLIDQEGIGSGSAEVMLQRVDDPDFDKWLTDKDVWGDQALKPIDRSRIPIWRIDVKYRKEDAEYDTLPAGDARDAYLAKNETYRKDRRRREAYQKGLTGWVEDYVSYYELPVIGYRQERFLLNNSDFAKALGLKVPERVPSEAYDDLLEKEDRTVEDDIRMAGYKLYVPDDQIEDYVSYKTLPEGTYEDDWFLMEHPDFYKEVYLKILGNQRKDYRKVPSREVWAKYQQYLDLDFRADKDKYRLDNPDLDEWGVLAGVWTETMTERRRRMSISQAERIQAEIEERLRKLKEAVGSR